MGMTAKQMTNVSNKYQDESREHFIEQRKIWEDSILKHKFIMYKKHKPR